MARRDPNGAKTLWRTVLTGPVSTVVADGDHYALLRPPLISVVATSIRTPLGGPQ